LTLELNRTLPDEAIPQGWATASILAAIAVLMMAVFIMLGTAAWVAALAVIALGFAAPFLLSQTWRTVCILIVPAVLTGELWTFKLTTGTRITPSLIVVFACVLVLVANIHKQKIKWRRLPLLIPFLMYILGTTLSYFPSVSKIHWARGLLETTLGLGLFLVGYVYLQSRNQLHFLLKLVLAAGVITTLLGLFQYWFLSYLRGVLPLIYDDIAINWVYYWADGGRIVANWAHPSDLGSVINLSAPIALYYYLESEKINLKYLFAYSVLAFGVIMTATRTPMVTFAVSSFILIVLLRKHISRLFLPFISLVMLGVAALPFMVYSLQRFDLSDPDNAATVAGRAATRYEAYLLFLQHPILGVGSRNYTDLVFFADPSAQGDTHNVFIQEAAETGLLGVVPFLLVLYLAFRGTLRRNPKQTWEVYGLCCALFAMGIATVLECLAENPLFVWQISCLFWLFRGIALALRDRPESFDDSAVMNC
jgi:O-antigen ligase